MESSSTIASLAPEIKSRTDIINQLVRLGGYSSYLEIGVRRKADNFDKVNCIYKVAVDPNQDCEYKMTSDEFFTLYDRRREFDLVFVDGLHTREQAFRDIMNALANLSPNGSIVVHDCNPTSEFLTRPYADYLNGGGPWNGSVWQAIAELRMNRADLEVFTFDIDHGTAVIRRGRQELFVAPDAEAPLDYAFLDAHRQPLLNLVQPDQFHQLIKKEWASQKTGADTGIDVVIAMAEAPDRDDDQLRYALRSIEKHLAGVAKVWVVGHKPKWLKNVNHVPFPKGYEGHNDSGLLRSLMRVCMEAELSAKFLFMGEDQCLLSEVNKEDFKPYYLQDLYETVAWNGSEAEARLKHTFDKLRSENKPAYHFEGHIPYLYDKGDFSKNMLAYLNGDEQGYAINTLYMNNCLNGTSLEATLQVNGVRAAIGGSLDHEGKIRDLMRGKKFLMYHDKSMSPALKKVLEGLFPDPSQFEST